MERTGKTKGGKESMYKQYLKTFDLASPQQEDDFLAAQRRTCYNGCYPFRIFPKKDLERITFAPITIFYGGNGSGKSTLLNIIAEKLGVIRHSAFNSGAYFNHYLSLCAANESEIPGGSQILTSDDVFDYMLNMRYLNDGIDFRREELFDEWIRRNSVPNLFTGMANYEEWKENNEAQTRSQSQYVRERLMRNVDLFSNGESAMRFFVEHISENALYLLDEPENSLAVGLQKELFQYIADSARHFGCQFVMATHSPIMLSMPNATIYNLDETPVCTKKWTELENVRVLFDFFKNHRAEFEGTQDES